MRPAARVLTRFSTDSRPDLPRRRGESFVRVGVHHSFWLCLTPMHCVFSAESRHCLCFFLVCAESRHCMCISAESRHWFAAVSRFYDDRAVFFIPSVCGSAIVCHAEHACSVRRWCLSAAVCLTGDGTSPAPMATCLGTSCWEAFQTH